MSEKPLATAGLKSNEGIKLTISLSSAIFAVVAIVFVFLRFWKIGAFSLWGVEAFTMIGVHQDWPDMFAYVVADIVHPPLFYILLKLWVGLGGESIVWLKLFPVLSGIGIVVPFYLLCREFDLQLPEINLALILAAVNGYLIHYAQELRMYSLFTFLAMCSFWLFIKYFKAGKPALKILIILTIVNLLAIYTHYYGWVVVGMEFLFLLIWQRSKLIAFSLSTLVLLFCFAPWAYLVIQEARAIGGLDRNLDWIPKPHLDDILRLYKTFNGSMSSRYANLVGLLLFSLPLLFWVWQFVRARFEAKKEEIIRFSWLALLAFVPTISLFLLSQWTRQAVWTDRYLIFIAIPYMILVSIAINQLKPQWLRYSWMMVVVLWAVYAGFNDLRTNRMAWEGVQLGSRVKWDQVVQEMVAANARQSSTQVPIYTLTLVSDGLRTGDWALSTSIDYFLDQQGESSFEIIYARDIYSVLDKADEEYFWVAYFETVESLKPSPVIVLVDNGFRLGTEVVYQDQNNRVILVPVWHQ